MPTFSYTAVRSNGERYKGKLEAKDKFDLYAQVRTEGGMIVSVREGSAGRFDMQKINALLSTVSLQDKISFTRNLAAMSDAGLALSRSLSVLERQTKNPKFKQIIAAVEESVRGGKAFHAALAEFPAIFSPLFVSMVRAGEESGGLGNTLRVIGEQMERSYALQKKIKSALIYPAIVVSAMAVIGVLMLLYIVPTLQATFAELGAELPASTQFIIALSEFLVHNTFVSLLLAGAVLLAAFFSLRTARGRRAMDFVTIHLPLVSPIAKEANAARTARTLSSRSRRSQRSANARPIASLIASDLEVVLTIDELLAHKTALLEDERFQPGFKELSDVSKVQGLNLGFPEMQRLAAFDREHRTDLGDYKLALVVPGDFMFGLARMYQQVTDENVPQVGVFRSFAEATAWLGVAAVAE